MGIEMDIDLSLIHSTKAEVNYDSLSGTFSIPDRTNISSPNTNFAFALDEKGIVFIDDSGLVDSLIGNIINSKRWAMPSIDNTVVMDIDEFLNKPSLLKKSAPEPESEKKPVPEADATTRNSDTSSAPSPSDVNAEQPETSYTAPVEKEKSEPSEFDKVIDSIRDSIAEMEEAKKGVRLGSKEYDRTIEIAKKFLQTLEQYNELDKKGLTPENQINAAQQTIKNSGKIRDIAGTYFQRKLKQGKITADGHYTKKMDAKSEKRVGATDRLLTSVKRAKNLAISKNNSAVREIRRGEKQSAEHAKINARASEYKNSLQGVDAIEKMTLNEASAQIEQMMNSSMTNYKKGAKLFTPEQQEQAEYAIAAVMLNDLIHTEEGRAMKNIIPKDPSQYRDFVKSVAVSDNFKRSLPENIIEPEQLSAFLADKNASLEMSKNYMTDMTAEIKASRNNVVNQPSADHKPEIGIQL